MRDGAKAAAAAAVVAALVLAGAGFSMLRDAPPPEAARHTPLLNVTGDAAAGERTAAPQLTGPPAQERIADDLAAGNITYGESLLYRAQVIFGDPRLPAAYTDAVADEDRTLWFEIAESNLTDAERARLRPLLVRPDHPESWRNEPRAVTTQSTHETTIEWDYETERSRRAGIEVGAHGRCAEGKSDWPPTQRWISINSSTTPVKVWGECHLEGEEWDFSHSDSWFLAPGRHVPLYKRDTLQEMRNVLAAIEELWGPMTDYMGEPHLDAGGPDHGGDTRIDIYLNKASRGEERASAGGALGVQIQSAPYFERTSSGYIIIADWVASKPDLLKSTLAHEFFHLQCSAYNQAGIARWKDPNAHFLGAELFWFVEASAVWAQWRFVPETSEKFVHPWYEGLTSAPTMRVPTRSYSSYVWPFYMQMASGDNAVLRAWEGIAVSGSWQEMMEAISNVAPFPKHLGPFGLRLRNDGHAGAVHPLFSDLDPKFPRDTRMATTPVPLAGPIPRDAEPLPIVISELKTFSAPMGETRQTILGGIPPLGIAYHRFELPAGVEQVRLDLTKVTEREKLRLVALVKARPSEGEIPDHDGWTVRHLPVKDELRICDAEIVILLLLNIHVSADGGRGLDVGGTLGYRPLADPCECDAVLDVSRWEATVSTAFSWQSGDGHIQRSASVTATLEGGDGWWMTTNVTGSAGVDNLIRGPQGWRHSMAASGPAAPRGFGSDIALIADPVNCQYIWSHEVLVMGFESFPNGESYPHFQSASTGGVLGVGFEVEGNDVPTLSGAASAPAYLHRPGPDWEPGPRYTLDCGGCRFEGIWANDVDPENGYLGDASLSWSFRPIWDEPLPDLDE